MVAKRCEIWYYPCHAKVRFQLAGHAMSHLIESSPFVGARHQIVSSALEVAHDAKSRNRRQQTRWDSAVAVSAATMTENARVLIRDLSFLSSGRGVRYEAVVAETSPERQLPFIRDHCSVCQTLWLIMGNGALAGRYRSVCDDCSRVWNFFFFCPR